ncbi:type I restriction enzyme, S subunit [Salegentibacter echinorum]|uniref:Type I restriction enzyme, S subunit n=1 Tax=Salegentibacter echinorum TaxID=1073325 RepID=A0A1M5ID44_SALEC|nr:restriction endonuclease subunit S [Salegentibacter echinorum]SHG26182.1 type I restriction enzyme, S subunit [Salegentibacter echinorum]
MSLNYKISPLNEVCSEIIDCVNKTAPVVDYETPYKMIRTTNVKKGYIDVDTVRYVTKKTFEKWTRRAKPKRNDIVLTREAPLGEIGLLRSDDNIFLGQRLIQYRANKKVIDQHYLYYAFQDSFMQGQIKSYGSGATVEHLRIGDCETIKVKYPSLPTQKKIASILSAYDDLIENNNQRIQLLEEMAEEIYKEWFVRLRFPGYQDSKFFNKNGEEVPHGTVGALPEGWKEGTVGDLIEIKKGKNITKTTIKEGTVPVVAGGLQPAYYHNTSNTKSPTITVSASGANAGFVNFYYEDIWASDCSFIDTEMTDWLYFFYSTLKTRQKEVYHLQKGSAQPHVYPSDIMSLNLKYPKDNLINKFEEMIKPFYEEISVLKNKNQVLQETRDLLLPRLISGKLNVDDLDVENNSITAMAAEPEEAYKS